MNKIPVFIFHKGNPEYLKYTIQQAQKYNEVHLLGDISNKDLCDKWSLADNYIPDDYYEFENSFVQMSDYTLEFDLICFKRFFIMRDYMEKKNLSEMVFADSDLLLYINLTDFYERNRCKVSLSIPERQNNFRWTAQAHCSFWTLEYLADFLKFNIEIYKNNTEKLKKKYQYHKEHNIKGGVCDMTLLYLWSQDKEEVFNTSQIYDSSTFDHCLGSAGNYSDNEYRFNRILHLKKIIFSDGQPYFLTVSGERIRANILHCQGSAKALIPNLMCYKYNTFSAYRKRYIEVFKRILNKIRRG